MILRRRGTGFQRDKFDFKCENQESATVVYMAFGDGERTPDFDVTVSWDDGEALVAVFAKAKRPEAVHLQKALALASAVKDLAENSN